MCLLVLAWRAHPRYRLIVAANRDEYHDRPAQALGPWPHPDDLLAGRDLRAGGTWLGMDRQRRFGVITNYRDRQAAAAAAPSRGGLIPRYLRGAAGAGEYFSAIEGEAESYGGFNLLLADAQSLWYGSNRVQPFARPLEPGIYGLSNERLDTPWPKLQRVRSRFEAWLRPDGDVDPAGLFPMLEDPEPAIGTEGSSGAEPASSWEQALSAPFVRHPEFGTRSATVLLLETSGDLMMRERRFDRDGRPAGESEFSLRRGEWL